MVERFLKQTQFSSVEDYNNHLEFIIPENFNFAYDVMDQWAVQKPDGLALLCFLLRKFVKFVSVQNGYR